MQFERDKNNRRHTTFEIDSENGFMEQYVASSALGTLTAKYADNPARRTTSARLGVLIDNLKSSDQTEAEENKPQPAKFRLTVKNARLLDEALTEFIEAVPLFAQSSVWSAGPTAVNNRAVQADMASRMREQLRSEFNLPPQTSPRQFGFH